MLSVQNPQELGQKRVSRDILVSTPKKHIIEEDVQAFPPTRLSPITPFISHQAMISRESPPRNTRKQLHLDSSLPPLEAHQPLEADEEMSVISIGLSDDTHPTLDSSWHVSAHLSQLEESEDEEEEVTIENQAKVVLVQVHQLEEALAICRRCSKINKITKKQKGASMTFDCICPEGHKYVWRTSKCFRRTPLVNTLMAAAIFCSGIAFTAFDRLSSAIGLAFFSEKTFYDHITNYLSPVIQSTWYNMWKSQVADIRKDNHPVLQVCGDGKFDSPGHSAKFCIYSLMSIEGQILDFVIFQQKMVSGELESKAFRFVFERLLNAVGKEKVDLFCSDRNMSVAKIMRMEFTAVKHAYDVSILL